MTSRESILSQILINQPSPISLPNELQKLKKSNVLGEYMFKLKTVGGEVFIVRGFNEINNNYSVAEGRVVTNVAEINGSGIERLNLSKSGTEYSDVEIAILKGHFGVAENGAVWITESLMGNRALAFICQHLVVIIDINNIVETMQEAYEIIGMNDYGYGSFIAGPSKTADIEQSLVLGAHGPRTMTVYILSG